MNPQSPADADDARRLISALADGEADPGESARGVSAWADGSSEARRSWHVYHLIGDVLRSEDLASAPARDQVFLERLRLRLADEPVVTVPRALTPPVDIGVERAKRKARWRLAGSARGQRHGLGDGIGIHARADRRCGLVGTTGGSPGDRGGDPRRGAAPGAAGVWPGQPSRPRCAARPLPACPPRLRHGVARVLARWAGAQHLHRVARSLSRRCAHLPSLRLGCRCSRYARHCWRRPVRAPQRRT